MDPRAQASAVAPEFVACDSSASFAHQTALTRAGALRLDAIDLLRGLGGSC